MQFMDIIFVGGKIYRGSTRKSAAAYSIRLCNPSIVRTRLQNKNRQKNNYWDRPSSLNFIINNFTLGPKLSGVREHFLAMINPRETMSSIPVRFVHNELLEPLVAEFSFFIVRIGLIIIIIVLRWRQVYFRFEMEHRHWPKLVITDDFKIQKQRFVLN